MKKFSIIRSTAQILTGIAAAGLGYALSRHLSRKGQVVVITGGSRGLGLALAERFGRAGCRLVLAARDVDELGRAREILLKRGAVQLAEDILLIPADLTDPIQAASLIHHSISHFGQIDVLINNAGIIEVGPVENQPLAAYHRAMDTNFFAALHTIQAVLPHMLSRRNSSIVNIGSIGGKFAMPHLLPYVASKFALVGFSEGLHAELRHKGVRVTTVCPGLMRTGSYAQAQFTGNQKAEYRWFALSATMPGLAASTRHAANRIFNAVAAGCAEITITPQAWLAARVNGLAPNVTQYLTSLANEFLLPAPAASAEISVGFDVRMSGSMLTRSLEERHNQHPPVSMSGPAKSTGESI